MHTRRVKRLTTDGSRLHVMKRTPCTAMVCIAQLSVWIRSTEAHCISVCSQSTLGSVEVAGQCSCLAIIWLNNS